MRSSILCPRIVQKQQNRKRGEVQDGPEFAEEKKRGIILHYEGDTPKDFFFARSLYVQG